MIYAYFVDYCILVIFTDLLKYETISKKEIVTYNFDLNYVSSDFQHIDFLHILESLYINWVDLSFKLVNKCSLRPKIASDRIKEVGLNQSALLIVLRVASSKI